MKNIHLIISVILIAIIHISACSREPVSLTSLFPETIEGLKRVQLITGVQALKEINKLHGKEIGIIEGGIGIYQTNNGPKTMVWISRSKKANCARHQTEVMIKRMLLSSHSPFHHPAQRELQGITIYQFQGMGQIHYIFFRNDLVFWISAMARQGDAILQAFLPEKKDTD
jgi:hypothetical protein